MSKPTDIRPAAASLFYLPVQTRVPLKFGQETLTSVTCARVRLRVEDRKGGSAAGWGETPLSAQWAWPATIPCHERHKSLQLFCEILARAWAGFSEWGHPLEVGSRFLEEQLPALWRQFNEGRKEPMPWLAALVCCSPFDIALHDAFGVLRGRPIYDCYDREFMNRDLAAHLEPENSSAVSFAERFPAEFLDFPRPSILPAWHLVGGMDWIRAEERDDSDPQDGHPVLLRDWIRRDGLRCLKVKLRGTDWDWDVQRLGDVGKIALEEEALWLSADFNCTVTDPAYVTSALDWLLKEHPRIYASLLYVEQPFPYELQEHQIDVRSVPARKPLFMDESAHDWRLVRLGRSLGWTGVALKTCKTQTGALLSLCWAKAHGMTLMVQDLTNPMLAQIPHLLLGAHAGTIMGVETNAMQFYPQASTAEAAVHPGAYQRRNGAVQIDTVSGPGFGYRLEEIRRPLPEPVVEWGKL
jgi:L-alanine-DL-glutamate epimerase-like enolase superfamily enzyme